MKKYMKRLLAAVAVGGVVMPAVATIPLDYYSSLNGLKGRQLKNAIHEIISNDVDMLDYGSGSGATWWGFYVTDRTENNEVIDRYSNDTRYFGSRGSSVSGMNIEHSFPKSWWGGSKNNAYKDLYNLMPSESKINSSKSNYPMGKVTDVTTSNGCTKIGTGSQGYKLWEPADEWKGDFARGYMYMATAYQDFTWSGQQALQILQQGDYPTLQTWAYTLFLEWAKADPVDRLETDRNDSVEQLQGNRNPFVDFPNLMEYVWGDSVDVAFNPKFSVKSAAFTGGGSIVDPGETPDVLFDNTFLGSEGGCTVEYAIHPSQIANVWTNDSKYGWVGSSAKGSSSNVTCYPADATLLTPEIDLTAYSSAYLEFEHAANYVASPQSAFTVFARGNDGSEVELDVTNWPSGKNWTFVKTGRIDLSAMIGKKMRIGFRYTSTASEAGKWEIKNLVVTGVGRTSGLEELPADMIDNCSDYDAPAEYYTIDGRRLTDRDSARGLVIVRRGSKVTKAFLR